MTETSAGARWPWLRGSFATTCNWYERGDGDREEEGAKWRQQRGGTQQFAGLHLKSWISGQG
jgi:hypothetical protein